MVDKSLPFLGGLPLASQNAGLLLGLGELGRCKRLLYRAAEAGASRGLCWATLAFLCALTSLRMKLGDGCVDKLVPVFQSW